MNQEKDFVLVFSFSPQNSGKLKQNMSAIIDPLGQTHSPASSDHYSHLKVLFYEILNSGDRRTDGQTPRVKIVITTGHDCGPSSWIKNPSCFFIKQQKEKVNLLFSLVTFNASIWDKNLSTLKKNNCLLEIKNACGDMLILFCLLIHSANPRSWPVGIVFALGCPFVRPSVPTFPI